MSNQLLTLQQLFTHATLMFANECLGELAYEATAAAILMAGLFLSFLVEYLGIRLVQWHGAKSAAAGLESAGGVPKASHASPEMVNIAVLEAGVIFHSLREPSRLPSHNAR
jgi:solute carrier family 39 (zinc transporter), member 1/2/3